ncbi:MAG: SDR family oxidoreductase [Pseudomonadota bacterium]
MTTDTLAHATGPGRLSGKTAFMTAAGAGIGRASALAMAREGARVIATDINAELLGKLHEDNRAIETFPLDATDAQGILRAAETVGAPDILFNCSGWVHAGSVLDVDDAVFDRTFDLNVRAHVRLIRAFLPAMIANGGGSIINMASVASSIAGPPNRCVYSASKGAVIGLTKSVAADFVSDNIRCNAVCPGTVDTPSLNERMADLGDLEDARKMFMARQPIGRFATADEVAALVVYLASDESAFVTGATHVIDGGWTL